MPLPTLDITNPANANYVSTIGDLPPLLLNIITWMLIFSGSVAVIIIILSGIRFILSGGEAKTVETAKKSMTYAIMGLLLVFFAFMIINVIGYVTGVACLGDIAHGNISFSTCQTAGSPNSCIYTCTTASDCSNSGGVAGGGSCNTPPELTCCNTSSNPSSDCPTGDWCRSGCYSFERDIGDKCTLGGVANAGHCCSSTDQAPAPVVNCPTGDLCRSSCFSFETDIGDKCTLGGVANAGHCCSQAP